MAYRTRRAFRVQYDLLLAASTLEEAIAQFEAPTGTIDRRLRKRLAREVESRRAVLAWQLQEFRSDTMNRVAPSDLLVGVTQIVLAHPPVPAGAELGAPTRAPTLTARLASAALGKPAMYACVAAWALTVDELVIRGIGTRPSLVAAELVALVLSPGAIFPGPR